MLRYNKNAMLLRNFESQKKVRSFPSFSSIFFSPRKQFSNKWERAWHTRLLNFHLILTFDGRIDKIISYFQQVNVTYCLLNILFKCYLNFPNATRKLKKNDFKEKLTWKNENMARKLRQTMIRKPMNYNIGKKHLV